MAKIVKYSVTKSWIVEVDIEGKRSTDALIEAVEATDGAESTSLEVQRLATPDDVEG